MAITHRYHNNSIQHSGTINTSTTILATILLLAQLLTTTTLIVTTSLIYCAFPTPVFWLLACILQAINGSSGDDIYHCTIITTATIFHHHGRSGNNDSALNLNDGTMVTEPHSQAIPIASQLSLPLATTTVTIITIITTAILPALFYYL